MNPILSRERSEDAERLADAVHVRHGPKGSGAMRQAGYVLYVAALLSGTYGVALTRWAFLQVDLDTVRVNWAQPLTWLAVGAVSLVGVVLLRRAGRVRGPAVPPPPWIDLVAATAIDRAIVLGESWHIALILCVGASSIMGAVIGLTGLIVGIWAPLSMVWGVLTGAALGWMGAIAWLSGQASTHILLGGWSITGRRSRRQISLSRLREQSARSQLLHGSVLVGDLREAQLSMCPPRASGRLLRLRPTGPIRTLVRRDLLGCRRSLGPVLSGLLLMALGVGATCWILNSPGPPIGLTLLTGAAAYLGCGPFCEGLRLQADTAGTPTLIGTAPNLQAFTHLIVPLLISLIVGLPTAVGVTLILAPTLPDDTLARVGITCTWVLGIVVISVAGQAWAAFRGSVPLGLVTSSVGPALTLAWGSLPLLVVAITVAVLTDQLATSSTWWVWPTGTTTAAVMLLLAIAGLKHQTDDHRV